MPGPLSPKLFDRSLIAIQKYFKDVTTVEDAEHPLVLDVIKIDIDKAIRKRPDACAFAQTCARVIEQCTGAVIGRSTAYVVSGSKAFRYKVPESMARELSALDRGGRLEPGQYRLGVFTKSRRLGHRPKSKHRGSDKQQRKQHRRHITTNIRPLLA